MTTPWYDVDMRGRRWEAIFKDCNTKYWNVMDEDLKQSYFNRMAIIEKSISPYIEQVLGVKKLIKQGTKLEANISR